MSDARCQIRPAGAGDAEAVAGLTAGLAQSFAFSRARSGRNYPALLARDGACLLLAVNWHERLGYLMGSGHLTFYASGAGGLGRGSLRPQPVSRPRRRPGPDENRRETVVGLNRRISCIHRM